MSPSPAIHLQDLTVAYRRHPAIHHLSGSFAAGSLTAVVGPNGAGKSTLLKAVTGVLRPASGRVVLEGVSRREIAYLPQASDLDRSFPITVLDLVALGAWRRAGLLGRIAGPVLEEVHAAIATVGLRGFERRILGTLSGGQLQRALFARMLLQDACLLLLDEPFAAVDSRTTDDLMGLVERWHAEGRTVIAVLHDLDLVRRHFPETLLVARSVVAWGETGAVLSEGNLGRARHMNEAWSPDPEVCEQTAA